MPGFLTTHVLDTASGVPAQGLKIELFRGGELLTTKMTNLDGRTDGPMLAEDDFALGDYRLLFHVGAYLQAKTQTQTRGLDGPTFLKDVPIDFTMDQDDHYHVPLLLSPYGYSTYRGS